PRCAPRRCGTRPRRPTRRRGGDGAPAQRQFQEVYSYTVRCASRAKGALNRLAPVGDAAREATPSSAARELFLDSFLAIRWPSSRKRQHASKAIQPHHFAQARNHRRRVRNCPRRHPAPEIIPTLVPCVRPLILNKTLRNSP